MAIEKEMSASHCLKLGLSDLFYFFYQKNSKHLKYQCHNDDRKYCNNGTLTMTTCLLGYSQYSAETLSDELR